MPRCIEARNQGQKVTENWPSSDTSYYGVYFLKCLCVFAAPSPSDIGICSSLPSLARAAVMKDGQAESSLLAHIRIPGV